MPEPNLDPVRCRYASERTAGFYVISTRLSTGYMKAREPVASWK